MTKNEDISPDHLEIILTEDGSHTLYSKHFNSSYHSIHGAIQESNHVFLQSGLNHFIEQSGSKKISILETGLGTGLNAFLCLLYALDHRVDIQYISLEKYPIEREIAEKLNYPERLKAQHEKENFLKFHHGPAGKWQKLNKNFTFQREECDFEDFRYPASAFDVIFFDPFDAVVQNELWEQPYLHKLTASLKPGGLLITYGAKGSFKRALKSSGLLVESLPGPPGKREITRAKVI